MKIEKNSVVKIHYELKNKNGEIIDSSYYSDDKEPLEYVHGMGFLLPKLEEALENKDVGEQFDLVLEPKDGYGEYNEKLIVDIPKEQFDMTLPIESGMKFQAETPAGLQIVTVREVKPDFITVDANHELAGVELHFHIEVVDVRKASEEELNAMKSHCSCGGGCGGNCDGNCDGECDCDGNCEGGCNGECGRN